MLLVYGPRSTSYDFGPGHPLTPRRFGPGIELLVALGAEPGVAPEPAPDEELLWCHTQRYLETVRRLSADPFGPPGAGLGEGGDNPSFAGMHEAAAAVAGGSLRAMDAILSGDVEHAFHPGGGLHHAMPSRASGFCIYDDPALAIARARRDGLRVLYVDLDVHHGDGVQAMHWSDPGVLTLSFHESGRYLFPGSGGVGELGEGVAAGTSVNVPLEPETGEAAWSQAVRSLLPELAAAFGPDIVVSQHGADSHAWDPLAHLLVTTTAMGGAARLVDTVAHRFAAGRWLATGGGGYNVYQVVPRSWGHVWLAGTHRDVPEATPTEWRERWAADAARFGQGPPPVTFDDPPNAGLPIEVAQEVAEGRSRKTSALVRRLVVPRLLREARDRGWWDPLADGAEGGGSGGGRGSAGLSGSSASAGVGAPAILPSIDAATWARLTLAPGVIAPADPAAGHALVGAGLLDGLRATLAVDGTIVVGVVLSRHADEAPRADLLALGVASAWRRRGLAGRLLAAHVDGMRPGDVDLVAEVTLAERDPLDPLERGLRAEIARRLLERVGFDLVAVDRDVGHADPAAISAVRRSIDTRRP